jgi:hypothetical protein
LKIAASENFEKKLEQMQQSLGYKPEEFIEVRYRGEGGIG